MPQYTSIPTSSPDADQQPPQPPPHLNPSSPTFQTYGLKIAKWVYLFDLLRVGLMMGLVGVNVDATVVTKDKVEVWKGLAVGVKGMSGMKEVELGVTVFYVSLASLW